MNQLTSSSPMLSSSSDQPQMLSPARELPIGKRVIIPHGKECKIVFNMANSVIISKNSRLGATQSDSISNDSNNGIRSMDKKIKPSGKRIIYSDAEMGWLGLLPVDVFGMIFIGDKDYDNLFNVFPGLKARYFDNDDFWCNIFKRYVRNFETQRDMNKYFNNKKINTVGVSYKNLYYRIYHIFYDLYNIGTSAGAGSLATYGAYDMINYLVTNYGITRHVRINILNTAAEFGYADLIRFAITLNIYNMNTVNPLNTSMHLLSENRVCFGKALRGKDYGLALLHASVNRNKEIVDILTNINDIDQVVKPYKYYLNVMHHCAISGDLNLLKKTLNNLETTTTTTPTAIIIPTSVIKVDDYLKMVQYSIEYGHLPVLQCAIEHANSSGIELPRSKIISAARYAHSSYHYHIAEYLDEIT